MSWLSSAGSLERVPSAHARRGAVHRRSFLEALEPRIVLDGGPIISEFVALNTNGLADEDGDHSDWIEIYNPTPTAIDLTGWYLTDNASSLSKWQFPAETLPAGGFIVVFASNKDRAVAGSELHTNFALSGDGEYLALVEPDGVSIASAYAASFPPQFSDVSHGPTFGQQQTTTTLNAVSDIWVRQSVPGTAYENDGMFVSTVNDGGQQRLGVVQFDLGGLATPINSAGSNSILSTVGVLHSRRPRGLTRRCGRAPYRHSATHNMRAPFSLSKRTSSNSEVGPLRALLPLQARTDLLSRRRRPIETC